MNRSGRPPGSRTCWLAIALLAIGHAAWAGDAAEKARIHKARVEADAALAAQEAECRQRFVVTSCLIEVRKQHRLVVAPLREESLQIDEKQRKQRAADRAERIRAKTEAASGSTADAPAVAASASSTASPRSAPRPLIRPRLRSVGPASATPLAEMPAALPASPSASSGVAEVMAADPTRSPKRHTPTPNPNALKESTDRLHEIEARRDSVLKRNAERAAKKPPAAPLPVPGALPASPAASPAR